MASAAHFGDAGRHRWRCTPRDTVQAPSKKGACVAYSSMISNIKDAENLYLSAIAAIYFYQHFTKKELGFAAKLLR